MDAHRSLPTPFIRKTYQLVDDPAVDDFISWNEDGSTFVVWRPAEFARDLLPKHFKHNNFSSFVRQLNTYGFRKMVPDRWEFANDNFRRGEKRLLVKVHRRKVLAAVAAANLKVVNVTAVPITFTASAIPATYTMPDHHLQHHIVGQPEWYLDGSSRNRELILDDNERLRKENASLNSELKDVRCMCKSIMSVISTYSITQPEVETSKAVGEEKVSPDVIPTLNQPIFEVLSSDSASNNSDYLEEAKGEEEDKLTQSPTMLFGVPIW